MSISTLARKLNIAKKFLSRILSSTLALPVVLMLAGVILDLAVIIHPSGAQAVYGGPEVAVPLGESFFDSAYIADNFPDDLALSTSDQTAGFLLLDESAAFGSNGPLAGSLANRDGVLTYRIQKGDTLSSIAASFGISLNTVLWANRSLSATALKAGSQIAILPVSGVLHRVSEGDTVQSIAALYGVPAERILKYNKNVTLASINQDSVIVPGAKPQQNVALNSATKLPKLTGYFAAPTKGWIFKTIHAKNGVDIANVCGTPVYASADGLVAESSDGWNGGYGNHIIVDHPNGTHTHYAHLSKRIVDAGDYVSQGQLIGEVGNTGNVHGPTGCHLHYEVWGAVNELGEN